MTATRGGPPVFDVLFAQRACREFADTPVGDDVIATILRAGTHAPSAENRQPWEFVVVRDHHTRQAIHDLADLVWARGGKDFSSRRLTPQLLQEVDAAIAGGGYRSAPVLVVVCADLERGLAATVGSSIFPCVQNMLLAAAALGLGSALTTLVAGTGDLSGLLGLPGHVVPQAVVPLGHPARRLGPPRREPAAAHTHRERYGNPWALPPHSGV